MPSQPLKSASQIWRLLVPAGGDGKEAARLLHEQAAPCVVIPADDGGEPELFAGDDHLIGLESIRSYVKRLLS